MKMLGNIWVISFLALFINLGVTSYLIMQRANDIIGIEAPSVHDVPEDEDWQFWSFHTNEVDKLIADLEEERTRLENRAIEVREMEMRMRNEQEELVRLREEIASARSSLEEFVITVSADEASNLKTLASTYAAMPPESAVAVFAEMDDEFVVKILSLMKSDVVSPIFAAMLENDPNGNPAERVATLTEKLRLHKQDETQKSNR